MGWFTGRQNAHVSPTGEFQPLVIYFPPQVHLFIGGLVALLGFIWYAWGNDAVRNAVTILALAVACYSAFYARRSILSAARERERRFETVKFSRLFSDAPLGVARTALATRFRQIFNQQAHPSERERHARAVAILSDEMKQTLQSRANDNRKVPPEKDLLDDATAVMDYFEDLAVGIDEGVFDDHTAGRLLRSALLSFWDLHREVAEQFRVSTDSRTIYENMEKLAEKWKRTKDGLQAS